jgi:hypothetical protein
MEEEEETKKDIILYRTIKASLLSKEKKGEQ